MSSDPPAVPTVSKTKASLVRKDPEIKQLLEDLKSRNEIIESCLTSLTERLSVIENKSSDFSAIEKELALIKANYSELLLTIKNLQNENKEAREDRLLLKINANDTQQRFRMCSIRVLNVKEEIKDAAAAATMLYNNFFRPAFGDEDPGPFAIIEYGHILPPNPDAVKKYPGFCYIVKFMSRFHKLRFFLKKKDILEDYNSKNGTSVKIQHDYTWANRMCLNRLHNAKEVTQVTFRGTQILYKLQDGEVWKKVTNPLAETVADMILKPAKTWWYEIT